ncbi:MAG: DUF4239 domain-containing protein [Candidatus Eremiobacteraeota bacterium]|nr:DUF4239 domain-containing protein [Candidatus Eremiobacteraeota bacterium]
MERLYDIPPVLLLVAAAAVFVAFACGGQSFVHRRFSRANFLKHNEVGGYIIAVVGTLYAVLLGFLTVVTWEHFADAKQQVWRESAAAADAWHAAIGLPAGQRARVRHDMFTYAQVMINDEWPQMRRGAFSNEADRILNDALTTAGTFHPREQREATAQTLTLQELLVLHDERQRRLGSNDSAATWFDWTILAIVGLSVIGFCWLFGLEDPRAHLLMTSAVALVIACMLVLLFELQYPFRSHLGVRPDTWYIFVEHVRFLQQIYPEAR